MHRQLYIKALIPLFLLCACQKENESVETLLGPNGLLQAVLDLVHEHYAKEVNVEKLVQGTINGALQSLDEFSVYYNAKDYQTFLEILKGEFGGIGAEIRPRKEGLEIIAPIDDGPAFKAGLRRGDLLIAIEGEKIPQMTPIQVLQKIHGKPGTKVKLTYIRPGEEPKDITVTRELIQNKPVKASLEKRIGYIRLNVFNSKSAESIKAAAKMIHDKLQEEGRETRLKGVILDLRDNPGGTLDQAVEVASLFLEKGPIVIVDSKDSTLNRTYHSTGGEIFKNTPIVVMINNGSASASEVVAGALRDNKRAILLGQKSYGKGSVQRVFDMGKSGAVSLTVAYFTTPKGTPIHGRGLEPDVPITLPELKDRKDLPDKDIEKERAIDLLQGLSALQGY